MSDGGIVFKANAGLTLIFLVSGELSFSIDDHSYSLTSISNQVLCCGIYLPEDTYISRHFVHNRWVEKYVLTVPKMKITEISQALNSAAKQSHTYRQWSTLSTTVYPLETLFKENIHQSSLIQSLTQEQRLLNIIIESIETFSISNSPDRTFLMPPKNKRFRSEALKIRNAIDRVFSDEKTTPNRVSLAYLGTQVNMSISKMQRIFKHSYNQTVADYVRSVRLNKAYNLLKEGKMSIGEASYLAGYRHTSNFAAAFKSHFGMTPGELLEKTYHRESNNK